MGSNTDQPTRAYIHSLKRRERNAKAELNMTVKTVRELRDSIRPKDEEIARLKDELVTKEKESRILRSRVRALEGDKEIDDMTITGYEKLVSNLRAERQTVDTELTDAKKLLSQIQAEKAELEENWQSTRTELEDGTQMLEAAQDKIERLQADRKDYAVRFAQSLAAKRAHGYIRLGTVRRIFALLADKFPSRRGDLLYMGELLVTNHFKWLGNLPDPDMDPLLTDIEPLLDWWPYGEERPSSSSLAIPSEEPVPPPSVIEKDQSVMPPPTAEVSMVPPPGEQTSPLPDLSSGEVSFLAQLDEDYANDPAGGEAD